MKKIVVNVGVIVVADWNHDDGINNYQGDGGGNHENGDIRVLVVRALTTQKRRLSKVM